LTPDTARVITTLPFTDTLDVQDTPTNANFPSARHQLMPASLMDSTNEVAS